MQVLIATTVGGWKLLGINNNKQLTCSDTADSGPDLILSDYFSNLTSWAIRFDPAQNALIAVEVPFAQYPTFVTLQSPIGQSFIFGVLQDGRLFADFSAAGQSWVIGMLYPIVDGYAGPSQPGGIGTIVTGPYVQTPDERNGKFSAGCGHYFNSFEVIQANIEGIIVALVCCPTCRYIQNIISPYDAIHSDVHEIIF